MDWTSLIVSITSTGVLVELGNLIYFRPKLSQARAEARIKQVEADDKRHDYLEERIASMERLYAEQGKRLDDVCSRLIEVKAENARIKIELVEVKEENRALKAKLDLYEK